MKITKKDGKIIIELDENEPSFLSHWWPCECGYSMPEQLDVCVKCGRKRPNEGDDSSKISRTPKAE